MSDATIVVKRRTWIQDLVRSYTVFVDGVPVGKLWALQTGVYRVTPGPHKVRLAIINTGTASSGDIAVDARAGYIQVLRTKGRGIVNSLKLPLSFPAGIESQLSGEPLKSPYYKGPWINVRVEPPQQNG